MVPGHDKFRRLQPLLTSLVVMMSQFAPCLGYHITSHPEEASIFRFPCCTAQPSSRQVEKLTCVCKDVELNIVPGDFPTSVNSIFLQMKSLTFEEDAVRDLHSLTSISLHANENIIFKKGGMKLHGSTSLSSFDIIGANFLHIGSHAFAGDWKDTTSVVLKDINKVQIAARGLSYSTVQPGPQIKMQNITLLDVTTGAVDAFVRRLLMDNVFMQQCRWDTFNEKIDSLELDGVKIPDLATQCFHFNVDQNITTGLRPHVAIKASRLGTVHTQAFSGHVTSLTLEDTELDNVHEHGFQANVKEFDIINSKIVTLHSRGFSITSSSTLSFRNVKVKQLYKNAFADIWMINTSRRQRAVSIDGLDIEYAEDGSLSLPACLPLDVSNLHIDNETDKCPTERWARRLLGAGDHQALSTPEYRVFQSLSKFHPCEGQETPRNMKFDDEFCAEKLVHEREEKKKTDELKRDTDAYSTLHEVDDDSSDAADDYPDTEGLQDGIPEDDSGGAKQSTEVGVSNSWKTAFCIMLAVLSVMVVVVVLGGLWLWRKQRLINRTTWQNPQEVKTNDKLLSK